MYEIDEKLVKALDDLGYHEMSEVQERIIPQALKGESLIVKASTGSGKTHAYLVPLLARLANSKETEAIILSPTRELARQIYEFASSLNKGYKGIDILLMAGGIEKTRNQDRLSQKPSLIIATPGRFNDLLSRDTVTSLKSIHTVVLDEADMLLDGGFFPLINEIIERVDPSTIQMYSATIPQKLAHLVTKRTGVKDIIDLNRNQSTSHSVKHHLIDVHHLDRYQVVEAFIKRYNPYLLLVFCTKNRDVKALYDYLSKRGLKVGLFTGDLDARVRKTMARRIKNDEFQIIVASDIAARGIDLIDVSDVLSLDFPSDLEFYFHRAGRTGRFFKDGNAYALYDHDDLKTVTKLEGQGVSFAYLAYRNDEFVTAKKAIKKPKSKTPSDKLLDTKIHKAVAVTKKTKVKPNHKKKVKEAVEKVKKRHKREQIKQTIKKAQAERRRSNRHE